MYSLIIICIICMHKRSCSLIQISVKCILKEKELIKSTINKSFILYTSFVWNTRKLYNVELSCEGFCDSDEYEKTMGKNKLSELYNDQESLRVADKFKYVYNDVILWTTFFSVSGCRIKNIDCYKNVDIRPKNICRQNTDAVRKLHQRGLLLVKLIYPLK